MNTATTFPFVMLRTCSNENNVIEAPTIKPIIFGFSLLVKSGDENLDRPNARIIINGNPTIVLPCAILIHA
jgi:hypothetical protein